MRGASNVVRNIGLETVTDEKPETFSAGFPLSQVAFYAGWYDWNVSGPFTQPKVEFMPGAFAYHLHSFSAETIRSTTEHWVGPLLNKGATATMGCVDEPYLGATPDIAVFLSRFIHHEFTFSEAACIAELVVVAKYCCPGDPLTSTLLAKTGASRELARRQELARMVVSFRDKPQSPRGSTIQRDDDVARRASSSEESGSEGKAGRSLLGKPKVVGRHRTDADILN